jgi:hypothetical protein
MVYIYTMKENKKSTFGNLDSLLEFVYTYPCKIVDYYSEGTSFILIYSEL